MKLFVLSSIAFGCATLFGAATLPAHAADYPEKPIRLVVPYAAGGGVDAIARQLARKTQEALGQPVNVDNRPGAGAIIGLDIVAKAPADGYTVLFTAGSSININPHVYKKLPYDPVKDLQPVVQAGNTPLLLLVSATNPAKNLAEFIADAKARPNTASFGSYGNGTTGHLLGTAFGKSAKIDILHVPFKGAAPAMTDLIGGNITSAIADLGSARALINGGKLRALAQTGARRNAALPNVPTFTEAGQPSLEYMTGWLGVFVPGKTPKDITDKLANAMSKALQSPELKASMAELGYSATGLSGANFEALVRADTARWGKVVNDMGGITLD